GVEGGGGDVPPFQGLAAGAEGGPTRRKGSRSHDRRSLGEDRVCCDGEGRRTLAIILSFFPCVSRPIRASFPGGLPPDGEALPLLEGDLLDRVTVGRQPI